LLLARIEERGGRRLIAAGHHLVHEVRGELALALRQVKRRRRDAVRKLFEILRSVEAFEGVRREELEGAQERSEGVPELMGTVVNLLQGVTLVEVQKFGLVIVIGHEPVEALQDGVECLQARADLLFQEGVDGFLVLVELDAPLIVEQIKPGVQGMVVLARPDAFAADVGCFRRERHAVSSSFCVVFQNSSSPWSMVLMSCALPSNSNL